MLCTVKGLKIRGLFPLVIQGGGFIRVRDEGGTGWEFVDANYFGVFPIVNLVVV